MNLTPEDLRKIFLIGKITGIAEGQKSAMDQATELADNSKDTTCIAFAAALHVSMEEILGRYLPLADDLAGQLPNDVRGPVLEFIHDLDLTIAKKT